MGEQGEWPPAGWAGSPSRRTDQRGAAAAAPALRAADGPGLRPAGPAGPRRLGHGSACRSGRPTVVDHHHGQVAEGRQQLSQRAGPIVDRDDRGSGPEPRSLRRCRSGVTGAAAGGIRRRARRPAARRVGTGPPARQRSSAADARAPVAAVAAGSRRPARPPATVPRGATVPPFTASRRAGRQSGASRSPKPLGSGIRGAAGHHPWSRAARSGARRASAPSPVGAARREGRAPVCTGPLDRARPPPSGGPGAVR